MDYNLALKLKQAGFPQKKTNTTFATGYLFPGDFEYEAEITKEYEDKLKSVRVYSPTLEEVIEACREGFGQLIKYSNGWAAENNWKNLEQGIVRQLAGPTPLIAVSNLYIALHKN